MKLYLFLRSIVWTSVLAIVASIASLIAAFIAAPLTLTIPLGLVAITLAILSPRSDGTGSSY
jgi:hypothetical protein